MLTKLDHIGIAVKSVSEVKLLFNKIFGLSPVFEESVPDQKVLVVGYKIGESNLEFLEPTSEDSPVAKYLEKRGEGLHHLAIAVENINEILSSLASAEMKLIDRKPRIGAGGKQIAFIHPKSTFGVLLELLQEMPK